MKSWRFFFCLLADGTYMFVKENVAKKGKSFRPTFSDTGYFMKPGQGVAKLSYSQHHSIESLWSFPKHLKLIKAQTFWQMKCRWFGERLFIIWWIISGQFCQQNFQLHLLQLAEFPPTGRNEQNSQPWAKFLVTLSKFSSCSPPRQYLKWHCRLLFMNSRNAISKITWKIPLCFTIISSSLQFVCFLMKVCISYFFYWENNMPEENHEK